MRIMICRCFSDGEESGSIAIRDENGVVTTLDESCGLHFFDLGVDVDGDVTIMAMPRSVKSIPVIAPPLDGVTA